MKAVAAIVQSWGWHRVIVIYEDIDSAASGVIPYLHNSLQETGIEISLLVPLPPFSSSSSSSSISEQLDKLKRGQCRVFVVHTSLRLATLLFHKAKEMEMVEKDYVWITTDTITSLVHAFNSSTISSMQGVLGVKSYFLETGPHFHDFSIRFAKKFSYENSEEKNHEPGLFALQAYNATRALALAITQGGNKKGLDLLDKFVLSNDFDGLSGNNSTQFTERKLAPAHVFQIINIVGKSYKEIGFWSDSSDGFGFSSGITIDGRSATNYYSDSMEKLGQVFWPGELRSTPKGWTLPTSANKLRIGVPNGTMFNLFTTVRYDQLTHNYTIAGLAIDIFKATVELLPYDLPYDLFPFDGTYDELVGQVYLKKFHAAIGGIAITAERYNHVDFSQPHTDGALVMIVPVQPQLSRKAWLFLKPFTTAMWILTAFINVYNGFVIRMIERDHCPELSGSALNQIGALLWLAFATLFSSHGEKLRSNLSRMVTVAWLFVALVVTQTYTANLTSMLTVQQLEPTVADIVSLKYNRAMVGCTRRSFVKTYLAGVLGFNSDYIKKYSTPEDIAQALRSKEIAAAFLESPWAKLFLARYCKSFIAAGPTYKIGGYGFVFPKGSPMISDINAALLELVDSGKLRELEDSVTPTEICVDVESDNNCYNYISLSPYSFLVLFIFTVGVSTIALVLYLIPGQISKFYNSMRERYKTVWTLIFAVKKYCWWLQKNEFVSTKIGDVEDRNPQIEL